MSIKLRLDQLLVDRGLVESKTKAQALILSGNVLIGTQRADKAGVQVKDDIEITIKGQEHPWVSRGGQKLDHAIQYFGLDVAGMTAIDVGASTGGFTDVLLHYGASKVFAVDVGHGQLAWKLREHPQVVVMEKTNARNLNAEMIPDPIDLVVCDASFIGLEKVLPAALALAASHRHLPEPSAAKGLDDSAPPSRRGEVSCLNKTESLLCSPLRGEQASHLASRGGADHFLRRGEKPFPLQHRSLARSMRKAPTNAERALWNILRKEQRLGFAFRRQQPIGRYIVDFVCFEKRVIIEADGGQHSDSETDKQRDVFLKSEGFQVLRFWNNEIEQNIEGVVTVIEDALRSPLRGEQASNLASRGGATHQVSLITLIKPQFEVGKEQVGKGGVVRDSALHQAVCNDVSAWLSSIGWQVQGITQSPITGPAGNIEFLLYAVYG